MSKDELEKLLITELEERLNKERNGIIRLTDQEKKDIENILDERQKRIIADYNDLDQIVDQINESIEEFDNLADPLRDIDFELADNNELYAVDESIKKMAELASKMDSLCSQGFSLGMWEDFMPVGSKVRTILQEYKDVRKKLNAERTLRVEEMKELGKEYEEEVLKIKDTITGYEKLIEINNDYINTFKKDKVLPEKMKKEAIEKIEKENENHKKEIEQLNERQEEINNIKKERLDKIQNPTERRKKPDGAQPPGPGQTPNNPNNVIDPDDPNNVIDPDDPNNVIDPNNPNNVIDPDDPNNVIDPDDPNNVIDPDNQNNVIDPDDPNNVIDPNDIDDLDNIDDYEPDEIKPEPNKFVKALGKIARFGLGMAMGAGLYMVAGVPGMIALNVAGGITNKFINNAIAKVESVPPGSVITSIDEPKKGIRGIADKVKKSLKNPNTLRNIKTYILGAMTGATLAHATGLGTPKSDVGTINQTTQTPTNNTPVNNTPVNNPVQTVAQTNTPSSVDFNTSIPQSALDTGSTTAFGSLNGDVVPLNQSIMNDGNSVVGRWVAMGPNGKIFATADNIQSLVNQGYDISDIAADVVRASDGASRAWVTASEIIGGRKI